MAPGDSGFAGDVFDTDLRGFLTAVPVLRLALAVRVAFVRFVLFPAITPPLDHLPHRRRGRLASRAAMVNPARHLPRCRAVNGWYRRAATQREPSTRRAVRCTSAACRES
jgi:hypothetical protein